MSGLKRSNVDMMRLVALTSLWLLGACADYPRDIGNTSAEVQERGTIRVGLVAIRAVDAPAAGAFIGRLARSTKARIVTDHGPTELQLARLDQGALDLVLGDFTHDSPWMTEVTIIEPIVRRPAGDRSLGLSPVAANGENRWIGHIEKTVRDMREDAGRD